MVWHDSRIESRRAVRCRAVGSWRGQRRRSRCGRRDTIGPRQPALVSAADQKSPLRRPTSWRSPSNNRSSGPSLATTWTRSSRTVASGNAARTSSFRGIPAETGAVHIDRDTSNRPDVRRIDRAGTEPEHRSGRVAEHRDPRHVPVGARIGVRAFVENHRTEPFADRVSPNAAAATSRSVPTSASPNRRADTTRTSVTGSAGGTAGTVTGRTAGTMVAGNVSAPTSSDRAEEHARE